MTSTASAEPVYAITLHQPWASLIALGIKTVETRSWPAPTRLVGQRIAVHAGKRLVRQPGDAIERELWASLRDDRHRATTMGLPPVYSAPEMVRGDLSGVPSSPPLVSSNRRPLPFRHGRPEER